MSTTPVYLMSPPRKDWALKGRANFKSRQAGAVDAAAARAEWAELATAIVAAGGEVVVLPPGDAALTGMIYTAEAGEYVAKGPEGAPLFLLPTMAAAHRRAEAAQIRRFVEERLGISTRVVTATWEAQGDAIRVGGPQKIVHTYGVGPERRTEEAAYEEVASLLSREHLRIPFQASPFFHGNTFLQFFQRPSDPDGGGGTGEETMMLVCPAALTPPAYAALKAFVGDMPVVELTREESAGYDTNALQVGATVLAPQTFSVKAQAAAEGLGLAVKTLHLGELFSKGGGAPVCLTNRLWGMDVEAIPEEVRWSKYPSLEAHTME